MPVWTDRLEDAIEQRYPRLAGCMAVMRLEERINRRQMNAWWRHLLELLFVLSMLFWFGAWIATMIAYVFSGIHLWPLIILGMQLLPQTAGAITREREQRSLDMLLMTRLSSWEILVGKLCRLLVLPAIVSIFALPVVLATAIASADIVKGACVMSSVVLINIIGLFIVGIGQFVSTYTISSTRAIVAGITLVAVLGSGISYAALFPIGAVYELPFEIAFTEEYFFHQLLAFTLILSVCLLALSLGFIGMAAGRLDRLRRII